MLGDVNLKQCALLQGIHQQTAYRWFLEGTLPVPAMGVNARPVPVAPDAVTAPDRGGTGLYARASSRDQGADLNQQAARLTARAARSGCAVVRVEAEVLASFCAHLHGRRPARNRAGKALRYAARDTGPASPRAAP
jgi:predicted site-specific integrase-resolvase